MKKVIYIVCFALLALASLNAIENFSIGVAPTGMLPIGSSANHYGFGGGAEVVAEYRIPSVPWISVNGGVTYFAATNSITSELLSVLPIYAGVGFHFPQNTRFAGEISAGVGYGIGFYQNEAGGSLYFRGGAGARFELSQSLVLGLVGTYQHIVSTPEPLYNGIGIALKASYRIGTGSQKSNLEFREIQVNPIFPVFYKYYDTNEFGSVAIINEESSKITDIELSFITKKYMDEPKIIGEISELKSGDSAALPIYALFNSDLLSITEGDKAAARLSANYLLRGQERTAEIPITLEILHRNAITWDDNRKVAAFVTSNDPDVIRFSNAVAGTVREDAPKSVNLDFGIGLGMFEAMRVQGLDYVVDPSSSYSELSKDVVAVDYLKYPGETLYYGAGDCDDLSTCYNALLESVGIDTAYITVPGHIFSAFAISMDESEAKRTFSDSNDLIFRDGRIWVPVETTMLSDGFVDAWASGAKQWRENTETGRAEFWPVDLAQALYSPVGGSNAGDVNIPAPVRILDAYSEENTRFLRLQIADREEGLQAAIRRSGGAARDLNRLGLLYARFGLYDDARTQFDLASEQNYYPAIVNVGNIEYLDGNYRQAAQAYSAVLEEDPDNPRALVGLAKSQFELENIGDMKRTYARLQGTAPDIAARYGYLVGTPADANRADSRQLRVIAEWEED